MRELIDLLESLNNTIPESRGLSGRKPGAVYKRGEGPDDQIVFQNFSFKLTTQSTQLQLLSTR